MSVGEKLRADAERFFEWCPFNFRRYVEALDPTSKQEFESGAVPVKLFDAVRTAWTDQLKNSLPWDEHFAVIRRVLPNPCDYDAWMNCSMHLLPKLPKRIQTAVANGDKKRAKEIHDTFFADEGEARLADYLIVWQSQARALNKLIIQAWGYRYKKGGGASVGETEIDIERMMLSEAEATGSAMKVTDLLPFIRSLWETEKTILVKSATDERRPMLTNMEAGLERKVIPNPERSEARLNRFLINLGRALADTKKRRVLPDWTHMDQTLRFVVHGWCENITVDSEHWPRLCFLTTPALAKFLKLCKPPRWKEAQDPRTLERAIARLGLVRIPQGRIKHVEKRRGRFYFS